MSETKQKHPATFSRTILKKLDEIVPPGLYLDPFAGTGKIYQLEDDNRRFVTVELEPEWAEMHPDTICGDSLTVMADWVFNGTRFDGVVTSPVYGNRMSDHHNAKDASRRRGYKFDLGRDPSPGSSGTMYFWQEEYRTFHTHAWKLAFECTRPGGSMFLNVSNFLRTRRSKSGVKDQQVQYVVPWHMKALIAAGYEIITLFPIGTPRLRDGENSEARVAAEHIIVAKKPGG